MTWSDPVYLNPRHQNDDPTQCVSPRDDAFGGSIVTDRHGNWLIYGRYHDGTQGGNNDIGVWRSTDNGVTWTGPTYLNTDAASDPQDVTDFDEKLVAPSSGPWIAVWIRQRALPPNNTDYDLMIARSFDAGATWSSPERLFTQAIMRRRSAPVSRRNRRPRASRTIRCRRTVRPGNTSFAHATEMPGIPAPGMRGDDNRVRGTPGSQPHRALARSPKTFRRSLRLSLPVGNDCASSSDLRETTGARPSSLRR